MRSETERLNLRLILARLCNLSPVMRTTRNGDARHNAVAAKGLNLTVGGAK